MQIKLGKFSADIPAWMAVIVVLAADSMYANHCKKKSYENALKAAVTPTTTQKGES